MILSEKRRGQSSVEFVLIAGVMFLVFLGMFVVIQGRMAGAYKERVYTSLNGFGNLLTSEIRLAQVSKGDYSRVFYLPTTVEGYDYTITINNKQEIEIAVEDVQYVIFLDYNISGSLNKGGNLINKTAGNITIKPFP